MKWKIGNVKIDNQLVLAPMAGVCDSSFRTIVKSFGCGLITTEMVSDKAIMNDNYKTKEMLYMTDFERPISQQIFGSESESFKIAAKYIEEHMQPDIIDINMGCPVKKVAIKSNAGSALLKHPDKAADIVRSVVKSVDVPVTVKIRSGWDHDNINAVEIAKLCEDNGASAVCIHPRTKHDKYDVDADWSLIKKVKDNVSVPVIGNGDVRTCYDAKSMIDETGCDAVMIGRAALGNPWLFKQCIDYLDYGRIPSRVTPREKISVLKKHAELLIKNKNEKIAMFKMRTHAAYYLKNLYGSVDVKPKLFKMNTKEELFDLLDDYLEVLESWN